MVLVPTQPKKIYIGSNEVKKVYLGSTQVRPTGWKPGANTIAYYQFDNNLNDSSGNSHNFSMYTGTPTYGTLSGGAKYIHFNAGSYTNNLTIPFPTSNCTINVWIKYDGYNKCFMDFQPSPSATWWNRLEYISSSSIGCGILVSDLDLTNWINLVVVNDGTTVKAYVNGVSKATGTIQQTYSSVNYFRLNTVGYGGTSSVYANNSGNNYMSELIIEDKVWTTQEIADYYNQTKSLYGIS